MEEIGFEVKWPTRRAVKRRGSKGALLSGADRTLPGDVWFVDRVEDDYVFLVGPVVGWMLFDGTWYMETQCAQHQLHRTVFAFDYEAFELPPPLT